MESSPSNDLAARTARASMVARIGVVLAFLLPTLVAGAIVWNGALRLTKIDARLKLERGRTRQVVDSLRREIDVARTAGALPADRAPAPRDTTGRRPADTIRVRVVDSAEVVRLRGEIVKIVEEIGPRAVGGSRDTASAVVNAIRACRTTVGDLQRSVDGANQATAACNRSVKVLQDSIAKLNILIQRLRGASKPPLGAPRSR